MCLIQIVADQSSRLPRYSSQTGPALADAVDHLQVAGDLAASVQTLRRLAHDVARALGGVVVLERRNRPAVISLGRFYADEEYGYADADLFGYLVEQPGFDATGYL